MSEESDPKLDSIIVLGMELAEGFVSMSEGVNQFPQNIKKMPLIVRPFVKRDFKAEMGLEPEEWREFLKRLTARLEKIRDAASAVKDGRRPVEYLREAATPFLERTDLVDEKIRAFQRYTADSPKKMEKAPKMFISDVAREQAKRAPEQAKLIGKAADGLLELREKLKEQLES